MHNLQDQKVNYHDSTTSLFEGVFARGDRRLAPVIVEAYKRGATLTAGKSASSTNTRKMQTLCRLGHRPRLFHRQRPIAPDEVTPRSDMDYGITHEYILVAEYNKALTPAPATRACNACGAANPFCLGGPRFDYSTINLV